MVGEENRPVQFGEYALLEPLGSGGMGDVFKAITLGPSWLQRQVAIKCMRPELTSSPALVEMFLSEARISFLLDHPNIVRVHDFGQIDERYFLTMEYLDGKTLRALLGELHARKEPLPVEVACFAAAGIANALAYAHTRTLTDGTAMHLVHHDVTPSNIMLLRTGGVKLLDFGVATFDGGSGLSSAEEPGILKGKLSYLAPECLTGRVDRRSDIFSLGVVLWESLIGRALFRGSTRAETMDNLVHRAVPPPSHFRLDVPPVLDWVILRALDRDPDRRYQEAVAMAHDLEELLEDPVFQGVSIAGMVHRLVNEEPPAPQTPVPVPAPLLELAPSPPAPSGPPPPAPPSLPALTIAALRRRLPRRRVLYGAVATAALLIGSWQAFWSSSAPQVVSGAEARRPAALPLQRPPVRPDPPAVEGTPATGRRGRKPVRARRPEPTLDPFARGETPTNRLEGLW